MRFYLLKKLILTASYIIVSLAIYGQTTQTAAINPADELFQNALQAKKDGNIDEAITLYEKAVKSSPTVLGKDDDGLVQAARENREKLFNLSPESSEAFDNLDFIYEVCLGDQQGMLPFLKEAYAATQDTQRKAAYKSRIDKIEQKLAEEAAMREKAEKEAASRAEAAEKAAQAKKEATDSAIRDVKPENPKEISEEEAEAAVEAAAEKAAAMAAAKKEAEEEAKKAQLNEELALNKGKMRRLDVRLVELKETIETQQSNLEMAAIELENAQQEFSANASAANRKKLETAKSQLNKKKKDLEANRRSLENLQQLRSAYHARIIRAKKGLGIISDDD